jgi:hypothetical protein
VRESVDERLALVQEAIADKSDIGQIREPISEELSRAVQERLKVRIVVQREVTKIVDEKVTVIVPGASHYYSQTAGHRYRPATGHYYRPATRHLYRSTARHGNPRKAAIQHTTIEPEPIVCRRRAYSARQLPQ